ncbi:uncharacterized protein LOC129565059 isoform X2 [Sitodiplosis mosellana]|uniref:uncharacterized protein LOC129565059 isoform X2 n=1 Tax=Sitodiplosis mosellana TaxID=263140 RepID=UPI002443DB4C|nr:uncharacterized protein LOC129565059 isoform X2 [Sitodiplosis mosellana]
MQKRHSNSAESFQLLQLSDDLKSLSDLELPEVVFQRKVRKVRRKTRPKPNSRFNDQETDDFFKFNCKYVSIWMCVTLSGVWLFLLSYMLAIVHSEFHELNKDVKKLSAICLSMPETLQKLHESSKTLEQNQTAISQKIYEVQQRLETVEKEFTQLRDSIRKGDGPEGDKAVDLKDTVAGFGAKIQALETDVKSLKEGYSGIQSTQQADRARLEALQSGIDSINNSSHSNFTASLQNETSAWVKNLTEHCSNGLKNVSDGLAALNVQYTQKMQTIDTEMHDHQTKLDGLNENFANVSSHVNSIESEWPKFKQSNQQLDATVSRVNTELNSLKLNVGNLNATLRDLLAQQGAKKATAQGSIANNSMFADSQSLVSGLQANQNESKVTGFPSEILNGDESKNATNPQPITPQPSNSNAQSSSSSAATSTTTNQPSMH